ncbi:hypothetical protein MKU92_000012 [Salmonella enterica]|nr:hypothetical protein [Salmonella enterica]EKS4617652.1 hypothetical protein [Salmonella enterica]
MNLRQSRFALMKFFSTEEYKQAFLDGQIFCNTPAYYRKSNKEGVGDRCESAIYSYYNGSEPDDDITFEIGLGNKIGENKLNNKDLISCVFRKSGDVDSWLNCWYILEERTTLEHDTINKLERMLSEFGEHVLLLKVDNFDEFLKRLKKYSTKDLKYCAVQYTDNPFKISKYCKLSRYSYQNEFRFMFGECAYQCIEPYSFFVPGGFRDLFMDGFWLRIKGHDDNQWSRFFK